MPALFLSRGPGHVSGAMIVIVCSACAHHMTFPKLIMKFVFIIPTAMLLSLELVLLKRGQAKML